MADFSQQRCLNHPVREAVARCPECRLYYCRECITEHDDRMICASCLDKLLEPGETKERFRVAKLLRPGFACLGLAVAWVMFFWLGKGLLAIPSEFHQGTVWQENLFGDPVEDWEAEE